MPRGILAGRIKPILPAPSHHYPDFTRNGWMDPEEQTRTRTTRQPVRRGNTNKPCILRSSLPVVKMLMLMLMLMLMRSSNLLVSQVLTWTMAHSLSCFQDYCSVEGHSAAAAAAELRQHRSAPRRQHVNSNEHSQPSHSSPCLRACGVQEPC